MEEKFREYLTERDPSIGLSEPQIELVLSFLKTL